MTPENSLTKSVTDTMDDSEHHFESHDAVIRVLRELVNSAVVMSLLSVSKAST